MKQRVDFFIVGAQKSGTTALDTLLRKHPNIQMAVAKEVHHFDDETNIDWDQPDHQRLHVCFNWEAVNVIRGEATPIYLFWPQALVRIKRYNPGAKIIIGLRHPTFRAYSQWKMNVSRGEENLSFKDAISTLGQKRASRDMNSLRLYSYLDRGMYSRQILHAYELFPRSQIHFYRMDDLYSKTKETLLEMIYFLQISQEVEYQGGSQYISPYMPINVEPLGFSEKNFLDEYFYEDIRRTETITGINLSDWLIPSYAENIERYF